MAQARLEFYLIPSIGECAPYADIVRVSEGERRLVGSGILHLPIGDPDSSFVGDIELIAVRGADNSGYVELRIKHVKNVVRVRRLTPASDDAWSELHVARGGDDSLSNAVPIRISVGDAVDLGGRGVAVFVCAAFGETSKTVGEAAARVASRVAEAAAEEEEAMLAALAAAEATVEAREEAARAAAAAGAADEVRTSAARIGVAVLASASASASALASASASASVSSGVASIFSPPSQRRAAGSSPPAAPTAAAGSSPSGQGLVQTNSTVIGRFAKNRQSLEPSARRATRGCGSGSGSGSGGAGACGGAGRRIISSPPAAAGGGEGGLFDGTCQLGWGGTATGTLGISQGAFSRFVDSSFAEPAAATTAPKGLPLPLPFSPSNDAVIVVDVASLHFSQEVFNGLEKRGIKTSYLTLHVGAGTFLPVKEENVQNHPMHREQLIFSKEFIRNLQDHEGPYIPVGTTSIRALESLYWAGVWLTEGLDIPETGLNIPKEFPYVPRNLVIQIKDSLEKVLTFMHENGIQDWVISTELLIMPGYQLRFCDAIITNFHQPKSTLLVLVSAIIGDAWKQVYEEAILQDYRFLSYGDACLFFK